MSSYHDAPVDALTAIWDALETHNDTRELFRRKFKFFDNTTALINQSPSLADLDSVMVLPADAVDQVITSNQDIDNYRFVIVQYTKNWDIRAPLRNSFKIRKALQEAKPDGGTVPFLAPYAQKIDGRITKFEMIVIDDTNPIQAIKSTMGLTLRIPFVRN